MILSLLALAAAQAAAPPVESPPHVIARRGGMSGPMGQMMAAYRACIETQVAATPANVTPEAGAALALAACKSQHDALMADATTMLSALPDDRQAMIRARIAERQAGMPAQIADRIRAARAGTAAPAH